MRKPTASFSSRFTTHDSRLPLLIALVALSRRDFSLGLALDVLRERAAHIVNLVEAALLVAPDVALVVTRVYQLAFCCSTFTCHCSSPSSCSFFSSRAAP